jgi:hypothetical protein
MKRGTRTRGIPEEGKPATLEQKVASVLPKAHQACEMQINLATYLCLKHMLAMPLP